MKDGLRSVFAAAGISAGCLCIWWGSNLRDSLDVGSSTLASNSSRHVLSTWVASRDNQVNVPAVDYYEQMVSLLKKYYVEQISDDDKLANGAVRGMIGSLGDPQSLYMEPADFHAYLNREQGKYEGIGVDLVLSMHGNKAQPTPIGLQPPPEDAEEAVATLSRFPRVVVAAVVPGGPADKSGVRVGDVVADIDGHWVVDEALLERFKRATRAFNLKKMSFSQIEPLQKDLREKTQRALLPVRTLGRLMVGTSGVVSVTWSRDGVARITKISKTTCAMPDFSVSKVITLPMTESGRKGLKAALPGKSALTLDLTHDPEGSFSAMLGCLQLLAPSGRYGEISNQRSEDPTPLVVQSGNPRPPKITLLVGRSTRGPAAVLALALSSQGKAILSGPILGEDVDIKQDVELPGGSGYDLSIGTYRRTVSKTQKTKRSSLVSNESSRKAVAIENLAKDKVADANHLTLHREDSSAAVAGGVK